ncbi:MAG: AmmeMemoRadiSam system protein B [Candidatus Rokubacteria bacterium GWC2_70_24]|nr:MAG: AmmeMemoRadiSam system protein B [Candidatus Rokubacteria bacterium GWA2_70_23]OGK86269.1 MAG: AmmeMemoRadiSam system protein B [Candidatus Rokubacteria bacterium GWC2_70_24]OGK90552.1 MAG: AmmeMemoRadiSam system protein B [Candidatus Rokubacteria bacterium GWF2_70_14]
MSESGERPRLRALEAFPVEQEGRRAVALRDPAGFTDHVAVLPIPLLDLVSLFDGEHSIAEMQEIFRERHGQAPTAEQIRAIVTQMDDAGFLDSPRFAERQRQIDEAFHESPVRPAAHAGTAYAGEAQGLRAQLDSFFLHREGPGARRSVLLGPDGAPAAAPLSGLIAPHIDFHRGGPTYAWAYRELAERSDADLFIILGTCHVGMPDPFAATLKPYETPLGQARADRDFLEALGRRYGHDLLASEGAHRIEHSVEFQVVMLQYLFGDRRPFTIVPLLASFLHEAVWRRSDPEADPRVPRFIEALGETMAASARRVCLVAGVDLAHVGPRFGDVAPNTEALLQDVERQDRVMLRAVTAGDPLGFFGAASLDGDARRICGLSPIYTFLRALPAVEGRLLRYTQWPDPEGAVTFCAAAFP